MKISDYIVSALQDEKVFDVFGIPGVGCGHLTDSLSKSNINNHITYHEQGAAFAACAYGQASKNIGMAYATAGPGATNLLTGIANAFVDSIPALYIVGDKDSTDLRGDLRIRQKASQEIDIVSMAKPITKWSYQVKNAAEIRFVLEKAIYLAKNGRPGPVLLDIPSDIQRGEYIEQKGFFPEKQKIFDIDYLICKINNSIKPLFVVGGGVKQAGLIGLMKTLSKEKNIPIVGTIVCDDELYDFENYLGFFGVDGDNAANQAIKECDLLVVFGARLNIKQVGKRRDLFAQQAQIIRIDIDRGELDYRINNEEVIESDLKIVIPSLLKKKDSIRTKNTFFKKGINGDTSNNVDVSINMFAFKMMKKLCAGIPENIDIVLGIGSHRRWFVSNRIIKSGWRVYQSAGLASMGFALPSSIGVYFANKRPVFCIDGDGGLLMNVQELQLISRERLPITVVVFNNHCLGEIMEFQKKVFNKNYFGTTPTSGYLSGNYELIANAFGLKYRRINDEKDFTRISLNNLEPTLIEVVVPENM